MWHVHDGMGWWMVFSGGMWILWLALIAILIVAVVRVSGSRRPDDDQPDAEEIVRRRYARGEINREEFEQLRRDLRETQWSGQGP